jgi:hypothetical protein
VGVESTNTLMQFPSLLHDKEFPCSIDLMTFLKENEQSWVKRLRSMWRGPDVVTLHALMPMKRYQMKEYIF